MARRNVIHPALSFSIGAAVIFVLGFQTAPILDGGRTTRAALIGAIPYFVVISVVLSRRRLHPTKMDLVWVYVSLAIALAAIPFALYS